MLRNAHRRFTAIAVAVALSAPVVAQAEEAPVALPAAQPVAVNEVREDPRVAYIGDRLVLRPVGFTPTKMEWVVDGTLVKTCEFPNGFEASECGLVLDFPAGTMVELVSYSQSSKRIVPLVVTDPAEGFGFAGTQETTVDREVGQAIALRAGEKLPAESSTIVWRRADQVLKTCELGSLEDVEKCSYTPSEADEGAIIDVQLVYRSRVVSTLTANVGTIKPVPGSDVPEDGKQADMYVPVYPQAYARTGHGGSTHTPTFDLSHDGLTFERQPAPAGTTFEVLAGPATVDPDGRLTVVAPKEKKTGEKVPVTVKVTYPDGSTDITTVEFLLVENLLADKYDPAYEQGRTAAKGKTITVHQVAEPTMPGVEYSVVEPEGGFGGWLVGVDKLTGTLTLTAPKNSNAPLTVKVRAIYADASSDDLTTTAHVNSGNDDASKYVPSQAEPVIAAPGESRSVTPKGTLPGSTFDLVGDGGLEKVSVDKATGRTDFTVPADAKPDALYLPVMDVTYPDGSQNRVATPVRVTSLAQDAKPAWGTLTVAFNRSAEVEQTGTVPDGTTFGLLESFSPAGWHVRIDETTGRLTATTSRDVNPGATLKIPVVVTYADRSQRQIEVPAEVVKNRWLKINDTLGSSNVDWIALAVSVVVSLVLSLAASRYAHQFVDQIKQQLNLR